MRTLEKSFTTSHPFHAKLVCHWPQINYQESGREQMWPTPNWLHQHSLSVCLSFFPSLFCFSLSSALLSRCSIHHCFVDLNMCLAHYKHSKALSIFWWVFPCVAVQTVPTTWNAFTRNIEGFLPIPFLTIPIVEFIMCGCMCSSTGDRIWLHSYAMMSLRNWEWKVNMPYRL